MPALTRLIIATTSCFILILLITPASTHIYQGPPPFHLERQASYPSTMPTTPSTPTPSAFSSAFETNTPTSPSIRIGIPSTPLTSTPSIFLPIQTPNSNRSTYSPPTLYKTEAPSPSSGVILSNGTVVGKAAQLRPSTAMWWWAGISVVGLGGMVLLM